MAAAWRDRSSVGAGPKGQVFTYAYDELHRQIRADYPTAAARPYLTT